MERYIGALTILILMALVLARVQMMKRRGIAAMPFAGLERAA